MDIKLLSMSLVNFKGIRDLSVDFSDETSIFGDNATGKTSLFDAFTWLLFGKDSTDRKDFGIKPKDSDGKTTDKVESEVSVSLDCSGVKMTLKRVFREKWQKVKGAELPEFTGNETVYFWNDVPMQQKEFMSKIDTIIREDVFKLITNPLYFNALKWQERREVLLILAGNIDDSDIWSQVYSSKNRVEVDKVVAILAQGKKLKEYKTQLAAQKKKAKDALVLIPSRVDEASRSKPESLNYDALRITIKNLNEEIAVIDNQISDKAKASEQHYKLIQEKQKQLNDIKTQLQNAEFAIKTDIRNKNAARDEEPLKIRREISSLEQEVAECTKEATRHQDTIKELEAKRLALRQQWDDENKKELVFDDGDFKCPTCNRVHDASDVEAKKTELTSNFNSKKVEILITIQSRGKGIGVEIEVLNESIKAVQTRRDEKVGKLEHLKEQFRTVAAERANQESEANQIKTAITENLQCQELHERIKDLSEDIEKSYNDQQPEDNAGLKSQKAELSVKVVEANQKLAGEELAAKIEKRIDELKREEKSLAQLIAEYEGNEFILDSFTKAKMNLVESRINDKFQLARFKMFNALVNGGEEETCETTFNGVPWSDLNTAAKIQVGIDIINTLSGHYKVHAPIWIDNRESTVRIPETDSQVVNLFVSPIDSKLRIEQRSIMSFA